MNNTNFICMTSKDLCKEMGFSHASLVGWVSDGMIFKCKPPVIPGSTENYLGSVTVFSSAEVERIRKAKKCSKGSHIWKALCMSRPSATPGNAISTSGLARMFHTTGALAYKVISEITGLPIHGDKTQHAFDVGIIPEFEKTLKLVKERGKAAAIKSMAETKKKQGEILRSVMNGNAGVVPQAPRPQDGIVKIHLKGMTIELPREDAVSLGEEIIDQL